MAMNDSRPQLTILAPRSHFDHVRSVNKQGWSLKQAGFDVRVIAKSDRPRTYLDMRIIPAPRGRNLLWRLTIQPLILLDRALKSGGQIFLGHNPDTLPVLFALKLLGRTVVYDTHEDFAERVHIRDVIPPRIRGICAAILVALEKLAARICDLMIVTQPQLLDRYRGNVILLDNPPLVSGPVVERAGPIPPGDGGRQKDGAAYRLVYAGEISRFRQPLRMLDLVGRLNDLYGLDVRFDLMGWFSDRELEQSLKSRAEWRYCNYLGRLPQWDVLARIGTADLGLAFLDDAADLPNTGITKLFEYMSCSIPFVATDFPYWRRLCGGTDAGIFVNDNLGTEALADTVARLLVDSECRRAMGRKGRQFIVQHYNWESAVMAFVEHMLALQNRGQPATVQNTPQPLAHK